MTKKETLLKALNDLSEYNETKFEDYQNYIWYNRYHYYHGDWLVKDIYNDWRNDVLSDDWGQVYHRDEFEEMIYGLSVLDVAYLAYDHYFNPDDRFFCEIKELDEIEIHSSNNIIDLIDIDPFADYIIANDDLYNEIIDMWQQITQAG